MRGPRGAANYLEDDKPFLEELTAFCRQAKENKRGGGQGVLPIKLKQRRAFFKQRGLTQENMSGGVTAKLRRALT